MGNLITKPNFPYEQLENCENTKCLKYDYKCKIRGYCIPLSLVCDGITHCHFGDDEENCGNSYLMYFSFEKYSIK